MPYTALLINMKNLYYKPEGNKLNKKNRLCKNL